MKILCQTQNRLPNVVGKKTGELVDTSKLKLQAVDLNSDIKRNYEALGRAVYESRKQGH